MLNRVRWVTEVIAENVQFLSPKDGQAGAAAHTSTGETYGHEVSSLDDDSIPF